MFDKSIKNLIFGNSAFEQSISMVQIILVIDSGIEVVTKPKVLDRITATYLVEKYYTSVSILVNNSGMDIPIYDLDTRLELRTKDDLGKKK